MTVMAEANIFLTVRQGQRPKMEANATVIVEANPPISK